MKRLISLLFILFVFIFIVSCKKEKSEPKEEPSEETIVAEEMIDVRFEVTLPDIVPGAYEYVIYGSFSSDLIKDGNKLTKEGKIYTITLSLKKGEIIRYNYAIKGDNESDYSHIELRLDGSDYGKRAFKVENSITKEDEIERFKDIMLLSDLVEEKELLDDTFYDNDGGRVHELLFNNNILTVNYEKKQGNTWSCILRPFKEDEIGKLDTITFKFILEKGVEYLIKLQNGDGAQEEYLTGTGELQEFVMHVHDGARNSKELVIFGHRGLTGTNENPLKGSYIIYSINVTLKDPDVEIPYVPGDNPIHILAIGNSFSDDALWLIYDILSDLGYDDIMVANLYIGGCSIDTHINNIRNNSPSYTYRINKDGYWVSRDRMTMEYGLTQERWDFISLQQASNYSGLINYYDIEKIDAIYEYAYALASEKNKDVKFVWQMTWAYQQNSTHSAFPSYDKNQMKMYEGIINCVKEVILNSEYNPIIVPNGTTVQNLRTSYIGDNITRDGYHLNEGFGRYAAALTFASSLTGLSIDEVGHPNTVSDNYAILCKEACNNAILKPYEITESIYKENPEVLNIDYSKLTLLDPSSYILGNGYYNSQDSSKYMTPIRDGSDFCNGFITTNLLTKDDLPVGSVIVLESGYQYRPEGWINNARQETRNPNTTDSVVLVTDSWWGDYIYRAFNISKVGGGVLVGEEYSSAINSFKIYIPK